SRADRTCDRGERDTPMDDWQGALDTCFGLHSTVITCPVRRRRDTLQAVPKRLLSFLIVGLLVEAAWGRLMEAAGRNRCACEPGCWCKRPVLSLFRWVTPVDWHRIPDGPLAAG